MTFLLPYYYRRRFNPEVELDDVHTAQTNLVPIRNRLQTIDYELRTIITRISRTYQIPIPGTGVSLSTISSPTLPTGDSSRDSARLLLLYLRAVLSKGNLRTVEKYIEKLDAFERQYFDADEHEKDSTGFWKRMEMGDEQIFEGIGLVKSWRDQKARDREWWPKIKEMQDAIKEGLRWEQETHLALGRRGSIIGSVASATDRSSIMSNSTVATSTVSERWIPSHPPVPLPE